MDPTLVFLFWRVLKRSVWAWIMASKSSCLFRRSRTSDTDSCREHRKRPGLESPDGTPSLCRLLLSTGGSMWTTLMAVLDLRRRRPSGSFRRSRASAQPVPAPSAAPGSPDPPRTGPGSLPRPSAGTLPGPPAHRSSPGPDRTVGRSAPRAGGRRGSISHLLGHEVPLPDQGPALLLDQLGFAELSVDLKAEFLMLLHELLRVGPVRDERFSSDQGRHLLQPGPEHESQRPSQDRAGPTQNYRNRPPGGRPELT